MTSLPSLAVIVATTASPYLASLIHSLSDAGRATEVVFAIDANAGMALDIIHSISSPRVRNTRCVRTLHNSGAAETRNLGFLQTAADYVVFVDDDDIIAPGAFDVVRTALASTGWPDVLYGNLGIIDPQNRVTAVDAVERSRVAETAYDRWVLLSKGLAQVGATYVASRYFDSVGGFRRHLRVWNDRDLQYRLILGGGRICFLPSLLMYWRNGHVGRLSELSTQYFVQVRAQWTGRLRRWPRLAWDPLFPEYIDRIASHFFWTGIVLEKSPEMRYHGGDRWGIHGAEVRVGATLTKILLALPCMVSVRACSMSAVDTRFLIELMLDGSVVPVSAVANK